MAAFVEQHGDPQLPPPYRFPGVSITSFRLAASFRALQDLCDKFFNIGTLDERGFEYRPLIPFVDLEILYYPRMECTDPYFANMGFTSQNEVYFRFFVIKYRPFLGSILLPTLEVSTAFSLIMVDNPWSVISGREVIGFSKNLADFRLPSKPRPYPIEISTQVFTEYGSKTPLQRIPVI